jgi:hypothetical protein
MLEWHPQSTCFPDSDTSNNFLYFWHYCVTFMTFLSTVDVAVLQNRHSLSMQYRCHATKKSREECVQNILFVHQLRKEKYGPSFSIPMHFLYWATTAVTKHNTNFIHISILMHFPCYYKFDAFHFIQLPDTRTIWIPAAFAINEA